MPIKRAHFHLESHCMDVVFLEQALLIGICELKSEMLSPTKNEIASSLCQLKSEILSLTKTQFFVIT